MNVTQDVTQNNYMVEYILDGMFTNKHLSRLVPSLWFCIFRSRKSLGLKDVRLINQIKLGSRSDRWVKEHAFSPPNCWIYQADLSFQRYVLYSLTVKITFFGTVSLDCFWGMFGDVCQSSDCFRQIQLG